MSEDSGAARAPAKVILLGEHAVNRHQPAVAAAVGLFTTCRVRRTGAPGYRFIFDDRRGEAAVSEISALVEQIDHGRAAGDLDRTRSIVRDNFFAPASYLLASFLPLGLPGGLELTWVTGAEGIKGLGGSGAAFAAMVTALAPLLQKPLSSSERAEIALRGDIAAHGGIASGLDTGTSLAGGIVTFSQDGGVRPLPAAPGLSLVIGDTGVKAATGEVNGRVNDWARARPRASASCFEAIGSLVRAAGETFARGDWEELGRLATRNHRVLQKIGVSCPELDRLIEAALGAGAFGAKLSGAGGGGIMIAVTPPESRAKVASAIEAAGGKALIPEIGVNGAEIL